MTANELRDHFNRVFGFGLEKTWPKTYEVDAVTYANCCQAAFIKAEEDYMNFVIGSNKGDLTSRRIWVGPNNGLLFKGVELILKS